MAARTVYVGFWHDSDEPTTAQQVRSWVKRSRWLCARNGAI